MYKMQAFDKGRNALRYIIKTYGIAKMHIPYYLCDVIRHTLVKENCKPVFYHIDDNFYPSKDFPKDDYVLYPNYWGVCGKNVKKLAEKYTNLIVDNAHAFFDAPSGFACFNAGHKFGYINSYLWIKNNDSGSEYEGEYINNNDMLVRKTKFLEIHKVYSEINLLNIDIDSLPFVYPCLVKTPKDADELVKKLKEEGKIIYRYWNPLPKSFCEYKFYSRLVPIPILPY